MSPHLKVTPYSLVLTFCRSIRMVLLCLLGLCCGMWSDRHSRFPDAHDASGYPDGFDPVPHFHSSCRRKWSRLFHFCDTKLTNADAPREPADYCCCDGWGYNAQVRQQCTNVLSSTDVCPPISVLAEFIGGSLFPGSEFSMRQGTSPVVEGYHSNQTL